MQWFLVGLVRSLKSSQKEALKKPLLCEDYSDLTSPTITLFTLAPWPWPSEVLFTLGELYPRQTSQPREDCLGEDLGEGQV